jgi:hypothetical protein
VNASLMNSMMPSTRHVATRHEGLGGAESGGSGSRSLCQKFAKNYWHYLIESVKAGSENRR